VKLYPAANASNHKPSYQPPLGLVIQTQRNDFLKKLLVPDSN
jgi:hypothetical protein